MSAAESVSMNMEVVERETPVTSLNLEAGNTSKTTTHTTNTKVSLTFTTSEAFSSSFLLFSHISTVSLAFSSSYNIFM